MVSIDPIVDARQINLQYRRNRTLEVGRPEGFFVVEKSGSSHLFEIKKAEWFEPFGYQLVTLTI